MSSRLTINLAANLANFLVSVVVSVFFTPYLVRHLGVAAYGVIPLATTISTYLTVLTLALNASVGRFVTVALERGDYDEANRYFNTVFFASLAVIALLAIPSIWLISTPEKLFRLPKGYEDETSWLLAGTVAMIMLSVLSNPFEVSSFCKNRFELRNGVTIFATLVRVGTVVFLFSLFPPRIVHVGVGILAAALVSFIGAFYVCKRLTPHLTLDPLCFSTSALKALVGSGGWIAVNHVGTLLLINIDLLVVNRLFGADSSGRYATLLQWSILLRGLAFTVAGVLGPTIVTLYARGETEELVSYSRNAVRLLGLFVALPVGLVGGLSRPILHVWLGSDFVSLAPLLTFMTVPLCINLGYIPLHNISTATNNVRIPGIVQLVAGITNLLLALFLADTLGWGMYGVAAAGGIVLTLRNVVFTPLYSARIIGKGCSTFAMELLPITLVSLLFTGICWALSHVVDLTTWTRLILFILCVSTLYAVVVWCVVMSSELRSKALAFVPRMGGDRP